MTFVGPQQQHRDATTTIAPTTPNSFCLNTNYSLRQINNIKLPPLPLFGSNCSCPRVATRRRKIPPRRIIDTASVENPNPLLHQTSETATQPPLPLTSLITEAIGLEDWRDDVCQRQILVSSAVAVCLVPNSSEFDVLADCCRRHSQNLGE
ncbi:hypothetical protein Bca52824_042602 [Brassica carinata]|uniref:Uncharacterized protein n=1 Tax=Brassica carinata TaxID=52824 RepID=A0A8X7RXK2_BRACI|nr:hypothetical protein Bca52824_042602 [Brassica carinata]